MENVEARLLSANEELRVALVGVYREFSRYAMPASLRASPVHDFDKILKDLSSAPLVQRSATALGSYASSAMTTIGDVADYKHFLPRIVHLACLGGQGQPGLDADLIASKLDYADWHSWPANEQAAIQRVYDRAWARVRLFHPDREEAEDWLCGNAMIGNDLASGLDGWLIDPTPDSMVQLAHLVAGATKIVNATGFWDGVPRDVRSHIADWLCGEAVEAALIGAVSQIADDDLWRFDSLDASISVLQQAPLRD